MKKIEQVFREILYQRLEQNRAVFTQAELSRKLGFSLSTVNSAIKKLEKMHAIKVESRNFKVIDPKKILYLWASLRELEKEIIYQTGVEKPVREIEQNLPPAILGAYSAYKFRFDDVPADYSEVYLYADEKELKEIKKRFPPVLKKKQPSNLVIIKKDLNMKFYPKTGSLAQIFVDLWNIKTWYAQEFLKSLEIRIKGIIGE